MIHERLPAKIWDVHPLREQLWCFQMRSCFKFLGKMAASTKQSIFATWATSATTKIRRPPMLGALEFSCVSLLISQISYFIWYSPPTSLDRHVRILLHFSSDIAYLISHTHMLTITFSHILYLIAGGVGWEGDCCVHNQIVLNRAFSSPYYTIL